MSGRGVDFARPAAPTAGQLGAKSDWPDGLDDEAAILRLQTILIGACEGNKDLTADRDYKRLRAPLIRRADLSDVVPKYIRAHRDLRSLWSHLKGVSDQWQPRREHVWESLRPLLDRIEGHAPVQSAAWTGRRTAAQQAKVVLALGPDAQQAVKVLLQEQLKPLGNGGPIDPEQEAAIEKLKELHAALGELIKLAQNGRPLGDQLKRLKALKSNTFGWSKEQLGLLVGERQLVGTSMVVGCGLMFLVNAITKGTALGAEGLAMGTVAATLQGTAMLQARKVEAD